MKTKKKSTYIKPSTLYISSHYSEYLMIDSSAITEDIFAKQAVCDFDDDLFNDFDIDQDFDPLSHFGEEE